MADFEIHANKRRKWNLTYTQTDGSPGLIDLDKSPTVITVVPDGGATVSIVGFDPATGVQTLAVDHNLNVGAVDVRVDNDGDLGAGVSTISITQRFIMLPPGGASGVVGAVTDEEDLPAA